MTLLIQITIALLAVAVFAMFRTVDKELDILKKENIYLKHKLEDLKNEIERHSR